MSIFNSNRNYDTSLIRTTSKDALKRSALFVCGGDIKQASEIYDFFIKDMPNMPDYDPVQPSVLEQTKDTITGVLGWVDSNQDKLMGYYNLFKSMRGAPEQPTNIPPLPNM